MSTRKNSLTSAILFIALLSPLRAHAAVLDLPQSQPLAPTTAVAVWGEQVQRTNNVIVKFGAVVMTTVNVYDVTIGPAPIQTFSQVKSIPLSMSDHAMVVGVMP